MPRTRKARGRSQAQPVLLVLCGPSHAGKSTFAKGLRGGFEVVSSDAIRRELGRGSPGAGQEAELWRRFESRKRKALGRGRGVILDACHMSKRARWHALQGPNRRYKKACIMFDVALETVRERWAQDRRVPLREVERMWRAFQRSKPNREKLLAEGFDEVHLVGKAGKQEVVVRG